MMLIGLGQAGGDTLNPRVNHGAPRSVTCPVGGETFTAWHPAHYSTYLSRPDGKPGSSVEMPIPLPVCPSNGLVIYREFDAAAVAKLTKLLATPEYRAMVTADSTFYRAQWLAAKLGEPERVSLGLLMRAIWQVKPPADRTGQPMLSAEKARAYQEEFARRAAALAPEPLDETFVVIQLRGVNALRETGQFEQAEARLPALREWARAAKLEGAVKFIEPLAGAIARRDPSLEPLDLLDRRSAAHACLDEERTLSAFDRSFCADPALADEIGRVRQMREDTRKLLEEANPR